VALHHRQTGMWWPASKETKMQRVNTSFITPTCYCRYMDWTISTESILNHQTIYDEKYRIGLIRFSLDRAFLISWLNVAKALRKGVSTLLLPMIRKLQELIMKNNELLLAFITHTVTLLAMVLT